MALLRPTLLLALSAVVSASKVTPVEQVITLITGLKNEVTREGEAEAATYGKFACFCKDETMKRSRSVNHLNEDIELKSADIGEKTQVKRESSEDLAERKANHEKLSSDLDQHNAQGAKDKANYELESTDLTKAISSLRSAIKAMQKSGGATHNPASLIEIKRSVLSATAALRTSAVAQQKLTALSKVDPADAEYGYHSNDIVDLCKSLLVDFKGQNDELNAEWDKTDKACKETRTSLKNELASNQRNMNKLDRKIEMLAKRIAEAREALVQNDGDLKDDQLYLKDLTARCEDRANDFDQRSQMRNGEVEALNTALRIITKGVQGADAEVNQRAALVQTAGTAMKTTVPLAKSLSFLQGALVKKHAQQFLARTTNDLALEAKKGRALSVLREEGRRIGSVAISALALRVAADPFKKVKGLIQKLIERLLEESAGEATKKGFCDEALASAEHERDNRFNQAKDLNRELAALEAKEDELTEEIEMLTKDIKAETKALKDATEDRTQEKADNMKALSVAKDGSTAVGEALLTLRSFYSSAAKAAAFLQASPVDEDAPGVASGAYNGNQGGMKAVFALLETIESDFDRTIRKTEEEESRAHREFVEFSQSSKASIGGKETKKELDEQDLTSTKTGIKVKTANLEDTTDLLDQALKELEELKPTCIDTGMSYKERVKKREEEMAALTKALCILDADKVEALCQ